MACVQTMMSLLKTSKVIFMVITMRKKTSLALTIYHAYLQTAQMISHLVALDTFCHLLFSTLSLQTGIRITTDSAGNPLFGFLMIVWIIMQVLHWKTQQKTHQDALLKANFVPNIWAPFAPKADCEIAMWAKIRGPSSTSLFELLNIEGVHVLFSVSAQCDTNYLQAAQYLGPLIQLCK